MGTVHLTQGHHGLFCREPQTCLDRRILLTDSMLELPIKNWRLSELKPIRESHASMTRAALRGLQRLEHFDAAVSITYTDDSSEPYLLIPHRTWGEISLGSPDNLIVKFSHDSRRTNAPFVSLYQWLEDLVPEDVVRDEVFFAFERKWDDPEKWYRFFREKISREIDRLQGLAAASRKQAKDYDSRARSITTALR